LFENQGKLITSTRITSINSLRNYELIVCDITPRQLLAIASDRLTEEYKRRLGRFRYGPGAYKVDYALSAPIPWKAPECARAATVHLGGTEGEIAACEREVSRGRIPEQPFVLLAQPSLFDSTRAPENKHTAWAYCHVPNGSDVHMLPRLEAQIERFAPGFRDCILARRVSPPRTLEDMNANLVGGDINGGALDVRQFLFRPTGRSYATSADDLFVCSSSTPPGGGVHGMCGYHAAHWALRAMARY
jgi:phytoene dehydrogenase-like protein